MLLLNDQQIYKLNYLSNQADQAKVGSRMSLLDEDGTYTGPIADGAVTVPKCDSAILDLIPGLDISAVDGGDGTAAVTIQITSLTGFNLAVHGMVRVFTSAAEWGAPAAVTAFTVDTGTLVNVQTADAELDVLTDETGLAELTLDNGGAGTVYVAVVLDGIAVSSGAIEITVE